MVEGSTLKGEPEYRIVLRQTGGTNQDEKHACVGWILLCACDDEQTFKRTATTRGCFHVLYWNFEKKKEFSAVPRNNIFACRERVSC